MTKLGQGRERYKVMVVGKGMKRTFPTVLAAQHLGLFGKVEETYRHWLYLLRLHSVH